jgi:hypothetical protein
VDDWRCDATESEKDLLLFADSMAASHHQNTCQFGTCSVELCVTHLAFSPCSEHQTSRMEMDAEICQGFVNPIQQAVRYWPWASKLCCTSHRSCPAADVGVNDTGRHIFSRKKPNHVPEAEVLLQLRTSNVVTVFRSIDANPQHCMSDPCCVISRPEVCLVISKLILDEGGIESIILDSSVQKLPSRYETQNVFN